mmetsp:Transcript_30097/g.75774  ORF Transcript_30097/g.75774 Transcript_30097/m.75774 type:complete len:1009 (+) Transcript_30097:159-3185(+)|eukprot:CAMPEP_0177634188 /NCGR_PEP_ID=MMETSP0447-20121125/3236_1 /TAXON_ID=0 /ORGANISM="Stygamoeba regulata, Strain BSH-02190019" /LENGTH=1008 /DNA_ID=CAMNT_0019135895 /DNA_START=268 /DNA_END=3294 /DNA_ORIENTATION=-
MSFAGSKKARKKDRSNDQGDDKKVKGKRSEKRTVTRGVHSAVKLFKAMRSSSSQHLFASEASEASDPDPVLLEHDRNSTSSSSSTPPSPSARTDTDTRGRSDSASSSSSSKSSSVDEEEPTAGDDGLLAADEHTSKRTAASAAARQNSPSAAARRSRSERERMDESPPNRSDSSNPTMPDESACSTFSTLAASGSTSSSNRSSNASRSGLTATTVAQHSPVPCAATPPSPASSSPISPSSLSWDSGSPASSPACSPLLLAEAALGSPLPNATERMSTSRIASPLLNLPPLRLTAAAATSTSTSTSTSMSTSTGNAVNRKALRSLSPSQLTGTATDPSTTTTTTTTTSSSHHNVLTVTVVEARSLNLPSSQHDLPLYCKVALLNGRAKTQQRAHRWKTPSVRCPTTGGEDGPGSDGMRSRPNLSRMSEVDLLSPGGAATPTTSSFNHPVWNAPCSWSGAAVEQAEMVRVSVYAQTSKFGKSFIGEADFALPTNGEEVFEWKPLRPRRRDKRVCVSGQIRVRIREASLRDALAPGLIREASLRAVPTSGTSEPGDPLTCDSSLFSTDFTDEGDQEESRSRRRCLKRIFDIPDRERILSTFSCSRDNRHKRGNLVVASEHLYFVRKRVGKRPEAISIPLSSVKQIEAKHGKVFSGVHVELENGEVYRFADFFRRSKPYNVMLQAWKQTYGNHIRNSSAQLLESSQADSLVQHLAEASETELATSTVECSVESPNTSENEPTSLDTESQSQGIQKQHCNEMLRQLAREKARLAKKKKQSGTQESMMRRSQKTSSSNNASSTPTSQAITTPSADVQDLCQKAIAAEQRCLDENLNRIRGELNSEAAQDSDMMWTQRIIKEFSIVSFSILITIAILPGIWCETLFDLLVSAVLLGLFTQFLSPALKFLITRITYVSMSRLQVNMVHADVAANVLAPLLSTPFIHGLNLWLVTAMVDGFEVTSFWTGFMASMVNTMIVGMIMDRINQVPREGSKRSRNEMVENSKRRAFMPNKQA